MEDYVEDYKYNNCFWKKSGVLYSHSDSKYDEFMSIGTIFQKLKPKIFEFSEFLGTIDKYYKKPDEPNYSRGDGIQVILSSIKRIKDELVKLSEVIEELSGKILEKKDTYESKKPAAKMCDEAFKKFDSELAKLKGIRKSYVDSINKVVESHLNQKYSKKGENSKAKAELQAKMKILEKKKLEYKTVLENVEFYRADYMEEQGNIFAVKEELERESTDELKTYFQTYIKSLNNLSASFQFSDEELKIIDNMNGDSDCKKFAESNKSLMTGPGRNEYREYAVDLNYYTEHFEIIKSKLKGKSPTEQREFQREVLNEINTILGDLIKEEKTEAIHKIEEYAKDLKENKLSSEGFKYLIDKFNEGYNSFMKWKEEKVQGQEHKKVGKEWDERFIYMFTFLKYFNRKRIDSKELNEENYKYFCDAIIKILDLNDNEDVDYNLCDLVVILSSTYYVNDPQKKSGKKYVNDAVKHANILQKQGFWIGLTKYELNEEIQKQDDEENALKENNISEEKLNNSVVAKLMSLSFNIMTFVLDSNLFNKILFDVFKYCKITGENRQFIVQMLETQIATENIDYLMLNKEYLLQTEETPKDC
jgi:hypothetical protein